ncbi:MAG: Gfo/Idh/MocA family oxidoreductase [Balneolales bacterium]
MKNSRRDFLKSAGLAGAGLLSGGSTHSDNRNPFQQSHNQRFNMSGYAAPPLETVRVGVIGLGSRGMGNTSRYARMEGVEIKAICDLVPEQIERAKERLNGLPGFAQNVSEYSGHEDAWKELCERDDIDLVVVNTPWHLHAPQLVYAMEHEKHAVSEVPIAKTIEECWQLIETSERTRRHCMMLANPCYRDFDMMTLNMARDGFFGEIIHGEGAYIHDLTSHNFTKGQYQNMWRLRENASRNGNLYPTHGFGTICNIMNVNCGDRLDYMVSVSGNDFTMGEMAKELAAEDPFYEDFVDKSFRGNMNVSIIRTFKGRTIVLQHDVSSPRPGVRFDLLSGTKGTAGARPPRIATSHDGWISAEEYRALEEKYTPEITKKVGEIARQVGGHGGMDTLLTWRVVDCLRTGLPLDMSVYDGVLWSAISPLSEWSVANRSHPVHVPDFTYGAWKANKPGMDINLHGGTGTTSIL